MASYEFATPAKRRYGSSNSSSQNTTTRSTDGLYTAQQSATGEFHVPGLSPTRERNPEVKKKREKGWNDRFHLESMPLYNAVADRHCLFTRTSKFRHHMQRIAHQSYDVNVLPATQPSAPPVFTGMASEYPYGRPVPIVKPDTAAVYLQQPIRKPRAEASAHVLSANDLRRPQKLAYAKGSLNTSRSTPPTLGSQSARRYTGSHPTSANSTTLAPLSGRQRPQSSGSYSKLITTNSSNNNGYGPTDRRPRARSATMNKPATHYGEQSGYQFPQSQSVIEPEHAHLFSRTPSVSTLERIFQKSRTKLTKLWSELHIPEATQTHFLESYFTEMTTENLGHITEEIYKLIGHRNNTLEVLKNIETREHHLRSFVDTMKKFDVSIRDNSGTDLANDKLTLLNELIRVADTLRNASLQTVESIVKWREYLNEMIPFIWKGQNYLLKMQSDASLSQSAVLSNLFSDVLENNPFVICRSPRNPILQHQLQEELLYLEQLFRQSGTNVSNVQQLREQFFIPISSQLYERLHAAENVILNESHITESGSFRGTAANNSNAEHNKTVSASNSQSSTPRNRSDVVNEKPRKKPMNLSPLQKKKPQKKSVRSPRQSEKNFMSPIGSQSSSRLQKQLKQLQQEQQRSQSQPRSKSHPELRNAEVQTVLADITMESITPIDSTNTTLEQDSTIVDTAAAVIVTGEMEMIAEKNEYLDDSFEENLIETPSETSVTELSVPVVQASVTDANTHASQKHHASKVEVQDSMAEEDTFNEEYKAEYEEDEDAGENVDEAGATAADSKDANDDEYTIDDASFEEDVDDVDDEEKRRTSAAITIQSAIRKKLQALKQGMKDAFNELAETRSQEPDTSNSTHEQMQNENENENGKRMSQQNTIDMESDSKPKQQQLQQQQYSEQEQANAALIIQRQWRRIQSNKRVIRLRKERDELLEREIAAELQSLPIIEDNEKEYQDEYEVDFDEDTDEVIDGYEDSETAATQRTENQQQDRESRPNTAAAAILSLSVVQRDVAAAKINKNVRRYLATCRVKHLKAQREEEIQQLLKREEEEEQQLLRDSENVSSVGLKQEHERMPSEAAEKERIENEAAVKIQSLQRMRIAKRRVAQLQRQQMRELNKEVDKEETEELAAIKIQSVFRGYRARKEVLQLRLALEEQLRIESATESANNAV